MKSALLQRTGTRGTRLLRGKSEIQSNDHIIQEMTVLCLHLLQNTLVLVNEVDPAANHELIKLDRQAAKRIIKFLHKMIAPLEDPLSIGKALKGSHPGYFWKYRLGNYRVIVHKVSIGKTKPHC